MAPTSFVLPPLAESADGSWGPPIDHLPPQFKDIPYTPYSKSDKFGTIADWNVDSRDDPLRPAQGNRGPGGAGRPGAKPAYGAGSASAFAYFHAEDEASFSLVDNRSGATKRPAGASRGRAPARGGAAGRGRGGAGQQMGRQQQGGRGPQTGPRGAGPRRMGWKDWDKPTRTRDASIAVQPEWQMLEEIEFSRLNKLRLDVEEPEDVAAYGTLFPYDKAFDRINTRAERPLQIVDRVRYNPTTSDDPVIQDLAAQNTAQIFATDSVLSVLMTAPRSVYPWDIVLVREGNKVFLDKREGGPFDFVSVNENAADPPLENEKESLNTPGSLSLEATYLNQNFAAQAVKEDAKHPLALGGANPFYTPEEESDPLASCAYRYRKFDLSVSEDEDVQLLVRTEVDSFVKGAAGADNTLITIKALNEFDPRAQGAGGAPDWRTKLDSQRGAVIATEMKNNSAKLARWAVQAVLAGAEQMKIGYISRANPRDASRHVVLGSQWYRPRDFASQLNVSLANGWGIVRTIVDLALKAPEGKYVLVKDPNRSIVRLYSVPADFGVEEEEEELGEEGEGEEA